MFIFSAFDPADQHGTFVATTMTAYLEGLRAAAEPTRMRLLAICADGELTVSEITRIVGQSQPRVSRHLSVLLNAGLLTRFREQHWVFYRLPAAGEGADLARKLLAMLPPDDEKLQLDYQRMAQVKAERARAAADFLRFHSDDWARLRDVSVSEASINQAICAALGDEPVGELLDIGTGTGRMLKLLGPRAARVVGIDISPDMLNVARSNVHAAGLTHVTVRRGDMYQLAFPDSAFDLVTVDQVLYQAEQPLQVIREAARILRPGGRLLIVDYSPFDTGVGSAKTAATRIGVSDDQLDSWLTRAGLWSDGVEHIAGDSLTVVLALAVARTRPLPVWTGPIDKPTASNSG